MKHWAEGWKQKGNSRDAIFHWAPVVEWIVDPGVQIRIVFDRVVEAAMIFEMKRDGARSLYGRVSRAMVPLHHYHREVLLRGGGTCRPFEYRLPYPKTGAEKSGKMM